MRIQSSFVDFYDCIQSHGVDQNLVYRRFLQRSGPASRFTLFPERARWSETDAEWEILQGCVHFCGSPFPFVIVRRIASGRDRQVFHRIDRFLAWAGPVANEWGERSNRRLARIVGHRVRWRSSGITRADIRNFENHFAHRDRNGSPIRSDPNGDHRSPVVVTLDEDVIVNPCLIDYGFVSVRDPYTAYQMIQQYLASMAYPEPDVPQPDDETLRDLRGFDASSFKRPKGSKKRRRSRRR